MYFSQPLWQGPATEFKQFGIYPWMQPISNRKDIYCSLWSSWGTPDLPDGYDYYIVTYHIETIDLPWLKKQANAFKGKIVVVFPGNSYGLHVDGIEFIGYIELHNDLNKMIEWFGVNESTVNKKYKFSTVCNRVSQSKVWTTTQILESDPNSLVLLNPDWIENKNVHNWQLTENQYLDNLTKIFQEKYINTKLSDGFDNTKDNNQRTNSNPWQPLYTDTALHIVAGSFHYSFMMEDGIPYIYPGPDIDEKTLKCLLAGVPFLPGMQFEVYKYLEQFGLRFDYAFDTSFDDDQGNLTRFEKLCRLIEELSSWSIDEITSATQEATAHNKQYIINGEFAKQCNVYNQLQIEKIYNALSTRR